MTNMNWTKMALGVAAACLLSLPMTALAQVRDRDIEGVFELKSYETPTGHNLNFLGNGIRGNLAEIELARLATTRGQSQAVRRYGHMLVKDHSDANFLLRGMAVGKRVLVPGELRPEDRRKVQRLSGLSGRAFDQAFLQQMITDHQEAIQMYETFIQRGTDPDLLDYARKTLPHLREHLRVARAGGLHGLAPATHQGTQRRRGG
jgi:putative membrane protein